MRAIIFALIAAGVIGWAAVAADLSGTNAPPAGTGPAGAAPKPAAVPANAVPAEAAPPAHAGAGQKPPAVAAPAANVAKRNGLSPEGQAEYATLRRAELELNAQHKLLTGLIDEHARLANDSSRIGSLEKSQWEGQLVQDLRNRSSQVLAQLNEMTKQRLAFEAAHGPRPASPPRLGALDEQKALNADEFAYVTRLDELLLNVRQQLANIDEAAKGLYSELQTNSTAEAVTRVSVLLDENATRAKLWEREQSELELRKLEFQALRK